MCIRGALTLFVNLNARARFFLILNSCSSAHAKAALYLKFRSIEIRAGFRSTLIVDVRQSVSRGRASSEFREKPVFGLAVFSSATMVRGLDRIGWQHQARVTEMAPLDD
jgi:hypothetical protein